jgi:adenylate cyclase
MTGTSETLQRASSGLPELQTLAAVLGGDLALTEGLGNAIRRLKVLVEVADTVIQRLSLDHQLPQLIDLIAEALDAECATLFLHDVDAGELFSRVAGGEGVTEIRQNLGIAGSVFASGSAAVIEDVYRDPRFNPEVDRQTGHRTRNILCVPLRNHTDQVIGVTQVLNQRSGGFTAVDRALLKAISRHAASALEQAQMMERLEQARREELELLEITEAISTELHIDPCSPASPRRQRSCSTPNARPSLCMTRPSKSFGPKSPMVARRCRSASRPPPG